jgi:hypothetical protein
MLIINADLLKLESSYEALAYYRTGTTCLALRASKGPVSLSILVHLDNPIAFRPYFPASRSGLIK